MVVIATSLISPTVTVFFAEHELRGLLLHADLRERGFVLEVQVIQCDFHTVARHVRCYRGRHQRDIFNKQFLVSLEYVRH